MAGAFIKAQRPGPSPTPRPNMKGGRGMAGWGGGEGCALAPALRSPSLLPRPESNPLDPMPTSLPGPYSPHGLSPASLVLWVHSHRRHPPQYAPFSSHTFHLAHFSPLHPVPASPAPHHPLAGPSLTSPQHLLCLPRFLASLPPPFYSQPLASFGHPPSGSPSSLHTRSLSTLRQPLAPYHPPHPHLQQG